MSDVSIVCSRERSPPERRCASAWILLGSSLGIVLVYLALAATFGRGPLVQALLYSSFNLALVLASLPTFLRESPRPLRWCLLALGLAATYGFFLAVTMLAERV